MSSYVYPFTKPVNPGRVDQGVDFTGTGPIVAIGNARILRVGAPGWPNGGAGPAGQGVLYELLDGPNKGRIIYVYEGIRPTVHGGELVKAGQQIGTFTPGSSIEIGLADRSGVPLSHGGYYEGKQTHAGEVVDKWLTAIGANRLSHPTIGSAALGTAGSAAGAAVNAAASLPAKVAEAVWSAVFDALGPEGARILLYIAFVLGGGGLVAIGVGRMAGVKGQAVAGVAKKTAAAAVVA